MSAVSEDRAPRSRFGEVWARLAPHLPGWADWAYALHASLCSVLALWLAMWLELDAPCWAGSTVLITSQASRAQGLLKGLNRVIGTAVGIVVGVTLIALCPQGWGNYLAAHTAWLALCTFASCLLEGQRSYAAALSGYTALIVAFDSLDTPDQAFATALSRGSAVVLGVTLFTLTVLLLFPSNDATSLREKLRSWLDDGLGAAARLFRGEGGPDDVARFLPVLAKLDGEIETGATEGLWIRPRKAVLRGAVLGLVDCVMEGALRDGRSPDPIMAAAIEKLRPRVKPKLPRDATGGLVGADAMEARGRTPRRLVGAGRPRHPAPGPDAAARPPGRAEGRPRRRRGRARGAEGRAGHGLGPARSGSPRGGAAAPTSC